MDQVLQHLHRGEVIVLDGSRGTAAAAAVLADTKQLLARSGVVFTEYAILDSLLRALASLGARGYRRSAAAFYSANPMP